MYPIRTTTSRQRAAGGSHMWATAVERSNGSRSYDHSEADEVRSTLEAGG